MNVKDFQPVSLVGSVYKILAIVLTGHLKRFYLTLWDLFKTLLWKLVKHWMLFLLPMRLRMIVSRKEKQECFANWTWRRPMIRDHGNVFMCKEECILVTNGVNGFQNASLHRLSRTW